MNLLLVRSKLLPTLTANDGKFPGSYFSYMKTDNYFHSFDYFLVKLAS